MCSGSRTGRIPRIRIKGIRDVVVCLFVDIDLFHGGIIATLGS